MNPTTHLNPANASCVCSGHEGEGCLRNGPERCGRQVDAPLAPRILIIDDALTIHGDFRKILAAVPQESAELAQLEAAFHGQSSKGRPRTGFRVDSAFTGQEGLERVREALNEECPYAVAFVDVRMPSGWDGIETTTRLRQTDPDLQIVICTAYSDYSWDHIATQVGDGDSVLILKKPFDTHEVLQLTEALNQKWILARHAKSHLDELGRILNQRTQLLNQRGSELRSANLELAREIAGHAQTQARLSETERMLAQSSGQLAKSSHQAGLAEVATGALHNVGNVLNSISVSVNILAKTLTESKASNLSQIAGVLEEHRSDLGQFMTDDVKGRQLPRYLRHLADYFINEHSSLSSELESLASNLHHIKSIVAMQQSYAKNSGMAEKVNVQELVEDALNLNMADLRQNGVHLIRKYDAHAPEVIADRHKVLQVLVNLIGNANFACDASGRPDKRMTMHIANGAGWVCISVEDNGIGISREILPRIFTLGFTTRKNGHGFGLHNCALAAKEMGGSLAVHSEGPHQGAIFKLQLPLCPQN